MTKRAWFNMKASGDGLADIQIFSEIGSFGVTAQDFHAQLKALGSPKEIRLSIDSVGGDVTTGFAIYNMLERHPANIVVRVEGLAASMASVIAMAGDEVEMPSNAMLMIHNPWGSITGEAEQIESFSDALKVMQENIANAYVARTGMKRAEVRKLMDKETWLSAKQAVELGFADRIEKPAAASAMAKHDLSKFSKVPAKFGKSPAREDIAEDSQQQESDMTPEEKQAQAKEMRDSILKANAEVRSLCALAGKPELADGYIAADKSASEVIADLQAKAAADAAAKAKSKGGEKAAAEVSAAHDANAEEREPVKIDTQAIYAKFNSAGKRGE